MKSFIHFFKFLFFTVILFLSGSCSREYGDDLKLVYLDMMSNNIVIDSVYGNNPKPVYTLPVAASIYSICASPDAEKIYFGLSESVPLHSVCVINSDGTGFKKIFTATTFISTLSVSPSGSYIGYVDAGNLVIINSDGNLVNSIAISAPMIISMSIDEPYIYAKDGSSNLIRYNFLTGSSAVVISGSFIYDCMASLMPDTDIIAAMTNGDLNTIYLTHLDGSSVISSNIITVTGAGVVDYFSFSPDGSIYAGSNSGGQVRLYNLDDGSLIRYISNARMPAFIGRPN